MAEQKRVVVLVSGGGTNLQALIDAQARGQLPHARLVAVISSRPGVFALDRARAAGIPAEVVDRKAFACLADFDAALLERLSAHRAEIVVLAGFLTIFGPSVVQAFPNRIINVHPALIPAFCGKGFYGLHVHRAALQRGVKLSGATVHLVNEEADGGPILLQKAVQVKPGDTAEALQKRVMEEAEWVLLPEGVEMLCSAGSGEKIMNTGEEE